MAQIIIGPDGTKVTATVVGADGALDVNVVQTVGGGGAGASANVDSKAITVVTAGTAVAIALGVASTTFTIRANDTNTGNMFVGDSTVSAATGYALTPGESTNPITADDTTAAVFVDSAVNGEAVTIIYES